MTGTNGSVRLELKREVAYLRVDRPSARNAMTMAMYTELDGHLAALEEAEDVRAVVLRGVGGSFIAGTDIAHFSDFTTEEQGVEYERAMEAIIGRLEALPLPTLAVIEGTATGGGLILAAVCDLRVCTPDARFGMPIARTVGHALSVANYARMVAHFGPSRTKALLFLARFIEAEEASAMGFVHEIVDPFGLSGRVVELCRRMAGNAPLTLRITKEAVRRILASGEDGEDLIRKAYGSEDFKRGVRAFLEKAPPQWEGR